MNEIEQTIASLNMWIRRCVEEGSSSEELKILPEVIKATAELLKASR
ncbi:hypothetical protein PP175_21560 [Aneurinibacillus sp. Ricciae_BoGa-3]|nr:hypothetical protein [Aneurinibacillus sp. Ricciae_BoGa-3]WCK53879.1 hypothetical protein PP175_21560 [Aneurinibacillus sp. Ricciae_BoGa-3]